MRSTVINFNLMLRLKAHIQKASAVSPSLVTQKKFLPIAEFKVGMGIVNCESFKKLRQVGSENRT